MGSTNNSTRILVVDDDLGMRMVVSGVLSDEGHEITEAHNAEEAIKIFREKPFPLVISDIVMGEMNGIDLLREIKHHTPETQVIIMTSNASLDTAVEALRCGAYDYLFKPFDDLDLITAVANRALEKLQLVAENQRLVLELKEKNENLERANFVLKDLAIRDGLTGQYNHRHFQESLAIEILRSNRHERCFSLIFLDVDNFKHYNDTHGHPAGDNVLSTLAEVLYQCLRRSDLLARYGGEEFVILLPETDKEGALLIAEKLRRAVEEHAFYGRETQPLGKVTVSMGVAAYPEHGRDGSTLTKRADEALYKAKSQGRNRVKAAS